MRPDEHKKKKNAAYKKKHGTPSPRSTPNQQSPSVQETKERQQPVLRLKPFQRRTIETNWHKYELEPDQDENVIQKGENYQDLLESAGSAQSHLRLKDELDWEEELDKDQDSSEADSPSVQLSINPEQLSQALSCLPVHEVLRICKGVFPEEQLVSNIATAEENKQIWFGGAEDPTRRLTGSKPTAASSSSELLSKQELPNTKPVPNSCKSSSTVKTPSSTPTTYAIEHSCSGGGGENKKPSSGVVRDSSKSKSDFTHSLEDELDFLLTLDAPKALLKDDDDSDKYVGLSDGSPGMVGESGSSRAGQQDEKKGNEDKVKKEDDDLEDWLDSVLDS